LSEPAEDLWACGVPVDQLVGASQQLDNVSSLCGHEYSVAGFEKFVNLIHYRKFLHFAANHRVFHSLYLLTSQNVHFIAFCSFTDEIKDSV